MAVIIRKALNVLTTTDEQREIDQQEIKRLLRENQPKQKSIAQIVKEIERDEDDWLLKESINRSRPINYAKKYEEMLIRVQVEVAKRIKTDQTAQPQTEAVADAGADIDGKVLSKLEKQQSAILKVISTKQFNPMAIPDNEKGTIKIICESDYSELFKAVTAFDRAWKHGIETLWKMENHESYAHRGND
jgi:hypothetical protein